MKIQALYRGKRGRSEVDAAKRELEELYAGVVQVESSIVIMTVTLSSKFKSTAGINIIAHNPETYTETKLYLPHSNPVVESFLEDTHHNTGVREQDVVSAAGETLAFALSFSKTGALSMKTEFWGTYSADEMYSDDEL